MEISGATECGLKVCVSPDGEEQTSIAFAPKQGTLSIDTNKSGPIGTPKGIEVAPFSLDENEALELRVFVDKSVIEVFANKRQALVRRIYPERNDSLGVSFFSKGRDTRVSNFRSWNISPSNPY